MRRRERQQEESLVRDLHARIAIYKVDSIMCARCRAWSTHDDAKAAGWRTVLGDAYCAACAAEEFGLQPSESEDQSSSG